MCIGFYDTVLLSFLLWIYLRFLGSMWELDRAWGYEYLWMKYVSYFDGSGYPVSDSLLGLQSIYTVRGCIVTGQYWGVLG